MPKYEEITNQIKGFCYVIHHGNGNAYISKCNTNKIDAFLDKEDGVYREAFWSFSDAKHALLSRQKTVLEDAKDYLRIIKQITKKNVGFE